jgi:hypothetical protein
MTFYYTLVVLVMMLMTVNKYIFRRTSLRIVVLFLMPLLIVTAVTAVLS